ncbi:MAG: hypothetical protein IJ933_06060 [Bacteroidales bacterium]|nr:hypothetical protein [Bacteroidales bacterium]
MKALSIELKIILFTLAAHLFYSNSELLIAAKEMVTKDAPVSIFDKTVLTAFALSYSVMTTVAVFTLRRLIPVLVFAALDGFAVYLRINVEQPQFVLISSLFYGFYTAYIIVIAYMLKTTPAAPAAATSAPAPAATLSTSAPASAQPVEPAAILGGESPSASPSKPAPRRARQSKKQLSPQPVPISAQPPAPSETTRAAPIEVPSITADSIRPTTPSSFTQLTLF